MWGHHNFRAHFGIGILFVRIAVVFLAAIPISALAQRVGSVSVRPFVTGFIPIVGRNGAVGGVSVDGQGVVAHTDLDTVGRLAEQLRQAAQEVPDALTGQSELRHVSLRRTEEAIAAALANGRSIPDAIQFLGGLTGIRYVLVYPENNDIVLSGPGEAWRIDERGNAVGLSTGLPVLQLEDLLIALRTVENARINGISCSINATAEGVRKMRSFLRRQRQFNPSVVAGIEKVMGPQTVTITGVPSTSRFARVMLASDYRMKRIAMKLEKSPVRGLSSYLNLIKSSRVGAKNMMPRWWLACDYQPLVRSKDGLAWELRGIGVKTMTETDFLAEDGTANPTGRASAAAQRWADQMTAKYNELSTIEPVFGELRNLMDLSVVAALIAKEDLFTKANCSVPHLTRSDSQLMVGEWHAPKTIATQCSFIKKGRTWIITASGGVQIDSWRVANQSVQDDNMAKVRTEAARRRRGQWCWD